VGVQVKTYVFEPVGMDVYDRRKYQPEPGSIVVKVQPRGCPRNGTMGHCYVVPVEQFDRIRQNQNGVLVLQNSLKFHKVMRLT
jgi:hypothetical protein